MIRQLARGEVDVVLGRQTEGHGEGDFISVPLVEETQVVVARARHPLARKSTVTFADLAGLPWMLQPPGSPQRIRFDARSEEHTSELQSLMRISYAVFCLKK